LYGSITSQDIADAIKTNLGVTVDKRKVQLADPIKAMGTYTVPVKLHRDVAVPLTVQVVKAAS
jgi:large subunit ribosomal protein L9